MSSASGSLGLFLKAEETFNEDGTIPLLMFGVTPSHSGHFSGMELFTLGCYPSGTLSLFLKVSEQGSTSGSLPLFVEGGYGSAQKGLSLYLASSGVSADIPLYIRGSGLTDGALPLEAGMNLMIQRDPTAALSLYLKTNDYPASGDMPLFLWGRGAASGSFTLWASGIGHIEQSMKLTVAGF